MSCKKLKDEQEKRQLSTSIPKINTSKDTIVYGWAVAISKIGAFVISAIAWAKHFVLPVLEE